MFTDYDLDANLQAFLANLQKDIESDRTAPGANEEEYAGQKVEQYKIAPFVIHPDQVTVSQSEVNIPAKYFPSGFWVDSGKSYPKPVLTFHVPFEGNPQWLKCKPSTIFTEPVLLAFAITLAYGIFFAVIGIRSFKWAIN
jgi:hypothetical protein